MATRTVEIFSAGCSVCGQAVEMIKQMACSSCDVRVLDMTKGEVAERAQRLGIKTVPTVVIDGELVDCCKHGGPDQDTLRKAGLGQPA